MLIFWRLLLGHLLADFTFQFDFIHRWKRKNLWGMLLHCGMHPVFYVLLTWGYLGDEWVHYHRLYLSGWVCVVLITILHFIEDEWRTHYVRRRPSADNTLCFLWDQGFHFLCLFLALPVGMFDARQGWFPEKWPVLLCLLIGATHFCEVLVAFLEKDIYGSLLPEFGRQYLSMIERLVLVCCLVFPGQWGWLLLSAFWIGNMFYLRRRRVLDFSWFSFYVGGGIAAICGLLARAIWYA